MSRRAAVTNTQIGSRYARQLIISGNLQKMQCIFGNISCKQYREFKDAIDGKAAYSSAAIFQIFIMPGLAPGMML
jgi:hypothetical protein